MTNLKTEIQELKRNYRFFLFLAIFIIIMAVVLFTIGCIIDNEDLCLLSIFSLILTIPIFGLVLSCDSEYQLKKYLYDKQLK